eukprot:g5506.t1
MTIPQLSPAELAALEAHNAKKAEKQNRLRLKKERKIAGETFAKLDRDMSKSISLEEFLAAKLGSEADFANADTDNSGEIDLHEYMEWKTTGGKSVEESVAEAQKKIEETRTKRAAMQARLDAHLKKKTNEVSEKFKKIDDDGSGELDKEEFIKAGLGTAKDFDRFDEDKSGTVSIAEYQKFQAKKKQRFKLEQDRRSMRKLSKEKKMQTPEEIEKRKKRLAARKKRMEEFRSKKLAKEKAAAASAAANAAFVALKSSLSTVEYAETANEHYKYAYAEREARMGRIDEFTAMQEKKWAKQEARRKRREASLQKKRLLEAKAAAKKLDDLLSTPGIDMAASKIQNIYRARRGRAMFKAMLRTIFSKEWDEFSQQYYYYNHRLGTSTWEKPVLLLDSDVGDNDQRLREIELNEIKRRFSTMALDEENEYDDFGNDVSMYAVVGGYEGVRYNYKGIPIVPQVEKSTDDDKEKDEEGENEKDNSFLSKSWEEMTNEEREYVAVSKLQGLYRRKMVRRNLRNLLLSIWEKLYSPYTGFYYYKHSLTGEIRYRAPRFQGMETSVDDEFGVIREVGNPSLVVRSINEKDVKHATEGIFGTSKVQLQRIVVKSLIGQSSGYVINEREYLGAPETDAFCAFSIPMPNTVEFKVQEANRPQRHRLYTSYTKTINRRIQTAEGLGMKNWKDKFAFYAYYNAMKGTDRFDVYWKRDGATRNFFRCERKAEDPWGWFFLYSFYAFPLVRIDVYKSKTYEHTYYFSGSEKMCGFKPPPEDEFEHEFSFYGLQYEITGTLNFNCMHTDKLQVGDDPGIKRSLRSRLSSEAPHSIWEYNCQFWAFDTPVRGTERLQIQISTDEPLRYRITNEFIIRGPWRHLNTVYVMGIMHPDAVKVSGGERKIGCSEHYALFFCCSILDYTNIHYPHRWRKVHQTQAAV